MTKTWIICAFSGWLLLFYMFWAAGIFLMLLMTITRMALVSTGSSKTGKHTWSLFVLGVFVCFLFYCHCILHFSIIDKVNILVYMYFRSVSIGCFCGQSALCLLNSYINKAFSQQKTSSHWILFSFFNHSLLNSRDDSLGQSQ